MSIPLYKVITNVIVTITTLGIVQDLFSIEKDYQAIEKDVERGQPMVARYLKYLKPKPPSDIEVSC